MQRRNQVGDASSTSSSTNNNPQFVSPQPPFGQKIDPNALDKTTKRNAIVGGIVIFIMLILFTFSSHGPSNTIENINNHDSSATHNDNNKVDDENHQGLSPRSKASSPVRGVPFVGNQKAQAIFGGQRNNNNNKKSTKRAKKIKTTAVAADGTPTRQAATGSSGSSGSSNSNNNEGPTTAIVEEETPAVTTENNNNKPTDEGSTTTVLAVAAAVETTSTLVAPTDAVVIAQNKNSNNVLPAVVSCYDWEVSCGAKNFVYINVQNKKDQDPKLACSFRSRIGRKVHLEGYGLKQRIVGDHAMQAGCVVPIMGSGHLVSNGDSKQHSPLPTPPHFLGDDVIRCFDYSEKFPLLQTAQIIAHNPNELGSAGGLKLACYSSATDQVCGAFASIFRWEPQLMDLLAYSALQLRRFRELQYLNFVRNLKARVRHLVADALKKKNVSSGFASSFEHNETITIPWSIHKEGGAGLSNQGYAEQFRPILQDHVDPNTITDDNYGVEFVDIGLHVGSMSSMMWRFGFPVKGFEPMHTNLNLLLATRCLNRLASEFSQNDSPTCKAQLSAEVPAKKVRKCLTKKVVLSNHGQPTEDTGRIPPRERSLLHSDCPVAEVVPWQLAHAAISANSGETCTMFSDPKNVGDVFVSCDKNLTETAKHHDVVFIRDLWYVVRGHVKTRQVDEYVFSTPEEACARVDEGVGGVRFQHLANRRKKEVINAVRSAYFDFEDAVEELSDKKKSHDLFKDQKFDFVSPGDAILAKTYSSRFDVDGGKGKVITGHVNKSAASTQDDVSAAPSDSILNDIEFVAAARASENDFWRSRKAAVLTKNAKILNEKADRVLLGEIIQVDDDDNNKTADEKKTASPAEEAELSEKIAAFEKELQQVVLNHAHDEQNKNNNNNNANSNSSSENPKQSAKSSSSSVFNINNIKSNFDHKDYIVKIDVEGHEGQLLKGADRWLSDPILRPKMLLIETWSHLDVAGFCKKMLKYNYVGLSSRVWPHWMVEEKDCETIHEALKAKGEAHDDSAWMPLEWVPVLAMPDAVRSLGLKLGKKLEGPAML